MLAQPPDRFSVRIFSHAMNAGCTFRMITTKFVTLRAAQPYYGVSFLMRLKQTMSVLIHYIIHFEVLKATHSPRIAIRMQRLIRLDAVLKVTTTSSSIDSSMQIYTQPFAREVDYVRQNVQLRAVPATNHIPSISTHWPFAGRRADSDSQTRDLLGGHALNDRLDAILST